MAFIPEADTGIVVLSNADVLGGILSRNVQYRLIEMLFGLEPLIDEVTAAELEAKNADPRYSEYDRHDNPYQTPREVAARKAKL